MAAVFGECGRLRQASRLFGALQYNYTYLLTYLPTAACNEIQQYEIAVFCYYSGKT